MMTATQVAENERNNRLRYAMDRLLYKLRDWVRVYPMLESDSMPRHDVAWNTGIDGGPVPDILEAIKMHPEMWADAIPKECCIVSRQMLAKLLSNEDVVEALAAHGAHLVDLQALRLQHEADVREQANRPG